MMTKLILRYAHGLLHGFLCEEDLESFTKEEVHD